MGTDIHGVFQKKTSIGWEDVPSNYEEGRHYFLFAWLAGVRNGYGFAGVPTHTPVTPISEPRGLPPDFEVDGDNHPVASKELLGWRLKWHRENEPLEIWMGDHSHSWLTADEILAAATPGRTWRTGIVGREFFDKWDGHTSPEAWGGCVGGRDVVVAEAPTAVTVQTTHVRIYWLQSDTDQLGYFLDEVRRLKNEHGEVRFVFGFDS